jgi:hypothetical protein
VRRLSEAGEWKNAKYFGSVSGHWDPKRPHGTPISASLVGLDGAESDLVAEISAANLVVMITVAGAGAEAASLIAEACSLKRVMITGLLLTSEKSSDEDVARTLKALRPYAPMLVVSGEPEYVGAMLTALRA